MGESGDLQFDHAEYEATDAVECMLCKQRVARYYECVGKQLCERCKEGLQHWRPGTPSSRFWRALGLGGGAAVLGAVLYFGITQLTGLQLGLMAIVVGIGVGMAVRKGSYNMGGAGYQVMAILLTWFAISAAYFMLMVAELSARGYDLQFEHYLALVPTAFAFPFISASNGNVLGLFIVGFGLYEAWKFNKRPQLAVSGPFEVKPAAPATDAG
jgi:hypothetical protein